jgi:hypothetical protein
MDVGIGLPNAVPDTTRPRLLEWARAAEEAGFSSLGTIDRIGSRVPAAASSSSSRARATLTRSGSWRTPSGASDRRLIPLLVCPQIGALIPRRRPA